LNTAAASQNAPPPDAAVRSEALDPSRSFHIESPAGSGKTTLLASRYLLLLGRAAPEEVLAVTFTRKAAGELRERILSALAEAVKDEASGANGAGLAELARAAVQRHGLRERPLSPERLRVMTFHSLCAWLAERWPLEAGLSPGTRLVDEDEAAGLINEALTRLRISLFRLDAQKSPLRRAFERRLLRLDNRWDLLEEELTRVISQRDLLADLLAEVEGGGEQLAATLRQRLDALTEIRLGRAREALAATELGRSWEGFASALSAAGCERASLLPPALPEATASQVSAWAAIADALLTNQGKPRQSLGPTYGYVKGFGKNPFAALIRALPGPCCARLHLCRELVQAAFPEADMEALADLVALAAEAVRVYEALCRERAVIDFAFSEKAAMRVLWAMPEAGAPVFSDALLAMDAQLRHVLVDEFQDTSRNQWALVKGLCAGFSEGEGRTLFIVGDPKQSIYGFRKAEVALFEEARGGLPVEAGLLPLAARRLWANFRSRAELVGWTNRVFARVMAEPFLAADEVPFAASEAQKGAGDALGDGGAVSLSLFTGGARGREAEARWLAGRVREEAGRLASGEKLAVLLFARTHLAAYVRAIREAGVAVSVREGLRLAERPEVAGLLALARALVRPHDDLAWAALLRSPWGMVEMAAVCAAAGLREAGSMSSGWQERLGGSSDPRLQALYEAVSRGQERLVGRRPLAHAVRSVWIDLHGPWESACRYGAGCLANCRATLDLLASCEQGLPELTLTLFEERLEGAYQPPLDDRPECAVQMMTVHAAKGLEFDAVFVPALDWDPLRRPGPAPPYLLERLPGPEGGHLVALPPDRRGGEADAAWRLVKGFADDRRLGEAKRLFYTAATRARRSLHLSATARLNDDGCLGANLRSPLGWLLAAEGVSKPQPGELEAADLGGLKVRVDPEAAQAPAARQQITQQITLPAPRPRPRREPLAYRKLSASELEEGEAAAPRVAAQAGFEAGLEARLRGTLIHRLLERAASGGLPGEGGVAAALVEGGLAAGRARELAAEALAEVRACLADPFLARGLSAECGPECELALESMAAGEAGPGRRLDIGVIDLIFHEAGQWWIVDYKTARPKEPGEDVDAFCREQRERHGKQLAAYRKMIASWKGVPGESVRAALYLTFLKRPVTI
jgi:ATP-dependent exoDNAse (exonuclease V) beta subunit